MQPFLQLSRVDQRLTMEQTAARIGWVASSVEKDFWVCWTLQQLFAMDELAPHLTFKGGTSLSKAWGLIDRFSEDIGLVRPVMGDIFPQALEGSDTMVHALAPERTFWEKAMLLHEETYRPADKTRRPRMARHYYDLFRLIEQGVGAAAVQAEHLFKQVAAHRQVFFAQTWVDYATLRPGALRLLPLPEQEASWRQDYVARQGEMFSVAPPAFDILLAKIKCFEEAFNANR